MLSMDLTNFDPSHVESIFDRQSSSNISNNISNSNIIDGTSGTMDVEDDVASWLDSLCSQQNNQQNTGVTINSAVPTLNGTPWPVKSELNGNNGDLMPRGDPLMGSFTNSILPANNDFDL